MGVKFLKFKEALIPIVLDQFEKGSFLYVAFNDCHDDIVDLTQVASFQDASYETLMAVINHKNSQTIYSLPFEQLPIFLNLMQLVHYIPNTMHKAPVCRKTEEHHFEKLNQFLISCFQRYLHNYSFESSKHIHCLPQIIETMKNFSMRVYIHSILLNINIKILGNYGHKIQDTNLYTLDILNLWYESSIYANCFKNFLIEFQFYYEIIGMYNFLSHNDVQKIFIPDTFLYSIHLIEQIQDFNYNKYAQSGWTKIKRYVDTYITNKFSDFKKTFTERTFHFFDSPLIKTYLNEKKIVIAGGFIGACLIKQNVAPDSDVDIFVFDKTILQNLLMEIESFAHSKQKHCYFLRKPMLSCIDVYIEDIPLVYSFVIVPHFVCTYQLLISFDMAHCQLAYNGSEVLGTIDGLMALKTKVSYYNDEARFNNHNYRIYEDEYNIHPATRIELKCLSRGFDCYVGKELKNKSYRSTIHKEICFNYATSFCTPEQNVKQICLNFNKKYNEFDLKNYIKLSAQEAFLFFTKFREESDEKYKTLQEWIVEQKQSRI